MKKTRSPKEIIKNYRIKLAGVCVILAAALAGLIWLMTVNMLVGIIGIIILAFNARVPFEMIRRRDIEGVLYEELDPEKFEELVALGGFEKSKKYTVLCAMTKGEHDKVLKLVDGILSKERNPLEVCNCIYRKAYVCFEKQDLAGVRAALREFEALKREAGKYAVAFSKFTVFEKFDAYLDEDYEYVRDVCGIDLGEINPKHQNHKLTRINVTFYRACALYKLGDIDAARHDFESIIELAPKMYKAKLAREWLEKM